MHDACTPIDTVMLPCDRPPIAGRRQEQDILLPIYLCKLRNTYNHACAWECHAMQVLLLVPGRRKEEATPTRRAIVLRSSIKEWYLFSQKAGTSSSFRDGFCPTNPCVLQVSETKINAVS
jgi:hypothetical protein